MVVAAVALAAGCHFQPADSGPAPSNLPLAEDAGSGGLLVDAAAPDALVPDMPEAEATDAGEPQPDAAEDAADDAPADAAPDEAPDVVPDLAPDLASDVAPDAADEAGEVSQTGVEAGPEAPPTGLLVDPCSRNDACASGVCSDGVCCANECRGPCQSCNLPGTVGLCMVAPPGEDPRRECPAEPASTCGRAGACDGNGACRRHPEGTVCGAGLACTEGYCARQAAPVPALWWRFDEAAGTVAADSSGRGRDGVYGGDPTPPARMEMVPPVRFANPASRTFTQAGRSMVRLAPVPVALKPVRDVTVSVWFRASAALASGSDLVNLGGDYFLRLKPDGIEWVKRASTTPGAIYAICRLSGTTAHLDGRWHHLTGVAGAGGMLLYLDGQLRVSLPRAEPILYSSNDQLLVGRAGDGGTNHDFDGALDDVRIYTRSLTATDVISLAAGNE